MEEKNKEITSIKDFINKVKKVTKEMGYEENKNIIFRNATEVPQKDFDKSAYFGYINPEEQPRGPYYDFSLVIFPQKDLKYCVVALAVGSYGFKNDLDLAMLPWTHRLFNRLRKKEGQFFFKNNFSNIDTPSSLYDFIKSKDEYKNLKEVIKVYKNYIQACQLINLSKGEEIENIKGWLAQFATLKGLAKNKTELKNINNAIRTYLDVNKDLTDNIYEILKKDRYVILQGAPGTGKTYNALKIAKEKFDEGNVFFEQFHAETSYSDFVFGITPKLNSNNLIYEPKQGILYKAIKKAKNSEKNVLLIIDEINRANLSNVLGPVFFLFEKNHDNRNVNLKIGDIKLSALPENLYVIGTMNTADRSLAVVDFALRRRFTWITLRPCIIKKLNTGEYFHEKEFNKFNELFEKYATDEELNLQPGQSYFITKDSQDSSMDDRLQYELMPLMKEYFNEGYLEKAKDEFCDYFYERISKLMYE
jgi:DNA replication protein DnaC